MNTSSGSIAALTLSACLIGGANAALLLTFTEEGGGVVMRTTGVVDISTATFEFDVTTSGEVSGHSARNAGATSREDGDAPTVVVESLTGIDLLAVSLANPSTEASSFSGLGDYVISNSRLQYTNVFLPAVADDNVRNISLFSSSRILVFDGESFESMGLDVHATNTDIGLWRASAGAGDDGTINFRIVSNVPEPSSAALLGLSCLSLAFRRSRR